MSSNPLDHADFKALGTAMTFEDDDAIRFQALLKAKLERQMIGLKFYRPLPRQVEFHQSLASERIVRGGTRSGKSTCAFAEVASAATGIPLVSWDGTPIPHKYPTDRPLVIWVIGYDERHIGDTIHRMFFQRRPEFRMIRDTLTGEWRPWNPHNASDVERTKETRPAPAFIPPHLVEPKSWAWDDRRKRVFNRVQIKTTKTWIHAYSSKAEPKKGDPVDIILIDEDIEYEEHVQEWQARLSDLKGRLIWSAFPYSRNNALSRISERAEEQKHRDKPDVTEHILWYSANPFIDDDEKRKRLEGWTEEEARARDRGEYVFDNVLVYPNYNPDIHALPKAAGSDKLDQFLAALDYKIPNDWTRYLALDPGHAQAAVLMCAVPPPDLQFNAVVFYAELYPSKCSADQLAERLAPHLAGQQFQAFVIDNRAGRRTPEGFDKTIRQQYSDAFARLGLQSIETGSSFYPGADNPVSGNALVREWLDTGKFRFLKERMPNMHREFLRYKKRITKQDDKSDKPIAKDNHLMDALRYLVCFDPKWVPQSVTESSLSPAMADFKRLMALNGQENDSSVYMGAGIPSRGAA